MAISVGTKRIPMMPMSVEELALSFLKKDILLVINNQIWKVIVIIDFVNIAIRGQIGLFLHILVILTLISNYAIIHANYVFVGEDN